MSSMSSWPPGRGAVLGGRAEVKLWRMKCIAREDFWRFYSLPHFWFLICLMLAARDVLSQLPSAASACHALLCPCHNGLISLKLSVKINPFSLKSPLVIVFLHGHRNVTNMSTFSASTGTLSFLFQMEVLTALYACSYPSLLSRDLRLICQLI